MLVIVSVFSGIESLRTLLNNGLPREVFQSKNPTGMVVDRTEDRPDVNFPLLAQQVDFSEGEGGHGHDMSGREK